MWWWCYLSADVAGTTINSAKGTADRTISILKVCFTLFCVRRLAAVFAATCGGECVALLFSVFSRVCIAANLQPLSQ